MNIQEILRETAPVRKISLLSDRLSKFLCRDRDYVQKAQKLCEK